MKALENRAIPSLNSLPVNSAIRVAQDAILDLPKPWSPEQQIMMSINVRQIPFLFICISYLSLHSWVNDIFKHFVQGTVASGRSALANLLGVINKAHLLDGKPKDFHALVSALETLTTASFLDCWRHLCGCPSIEAFAESNPTVEDILSIAREIVIEKVNRIVPKDPSFEDDDKYTSPQEESYKSDQVFWNHRILLASLIRVVILRHAICDADVGRVEDMMGSVMICFLGMKKDTMAKEVMHFIHGVKHLWPEPFA